MGEKTLFREEQYLRQPWLWALLGGEALLCLWAFVQQIVLGEPWGDNPASDPLLIVIVAVFGVGLPLAFLVMHLSVEVRQDRLLVRFFPLNLEHRTYSKEAIASHRAVAYRPLRDFGGWGIRYGGLGKMFSMSGDRAVLLELRDGKTLLIGSRRAEELDLAISMMSSSSPG